MVADHPGGNHAVGGDRSTGADDETDVVVDAVRHAEIGGGASVDEQGGRTGTRERGGLQADAAVAGSTVETQRTTASNRQVTDDFRRDREGRSTAGRTQHAKDGAIEYERGGIAKAIDHRRDVLGAAIELETTARVERHGVGVIIAVSTRDEGAVGEVANRAFIAEGELAEDVDGTAGTQGAGGGGRGLVDDEVRAAVDDCAARVGVQVTRRDRPRTELRLLAG